MANMRCRPLKVAADEKDVVTKTSDHDFQLSLLIQTFLTFHQLFIQSKKAKVIFRPLGIVADAKARNHWKAHPWLPFCDLDRLFFFGSKFA